MSQRPLAWLQGKAKARGLGFRGEVIVEDGDDLEAMPHDSYAEFLGGVWKVLTMGRRYVRWVMSAPVQKDRGVVHTVNERIDRSVIERCRRHADYRPASLWEWAARRNVDLEQVIREPEQYAPLYVEVTQPGVEPPA